MFVSDIYLSLLMTSAHYVKFFKHMCLLKYYNKQEHLLWFSLIFGRGQNQGGFRQKNFAYI
jgi:hypothetical protein